ncbi:MAG: T9SS type A sorting domain-containing protein [Sphingobacteriaceae bacterium]|nr:T9SS type A sorting domain-containing protein [Sphingobacteriaceae bacterium]
MNENIKLGPNPVAGFINIYREVQSIGSSEIEIINSLGQTVLKTEFKNQIDVSELASGFYTLLLKYKEGSVITKKFVKE